MRRQFTSVTGTGVSAPIALDHYISPFNIGFGAVVSATATFSVQHTFDDIFSATYVPASGTWFNHPNFTSATATGDGNYAFPVTAVRLNVTASTGSVSLTLIQAGQVGG
jgi:hypothetical protein